jgi:hypothetical protein
LSMGFWGKFAQATRVGMFAASFVLVAFSSEAAEIPWSSSAPFKYSNEDVRDALRVIIEANGLQPIIRQGVQGSIAGEIKDTTMEAAFIKLIEENNLTYDYDAVRKTVTISPEALARM